MSSTLLHIAVVYIVGAALSGAWVWGVARWFGVRFPVADLVIIVGLCTGLGLLPSYGWLLGMVFMWLLVTRVERAEVWPETMLMAGGSGAIWLIASLSILVRLS